MSTSRPVLEHEHTPAAIAARLEAARRHSMLGDFVLGAIDGVITTFAIVAGVAGAGLSTGAALVLGLANVLADGFSMAVGNYLRTRAEGQVVERYRAMEERHIRQAPRGEREEVRQIFAAKGFEGPVLEEIVDTVTANPQLWVDTMLTEEHGLQIEPPSPMKAAWVTFAAFLGAGIIPLLPLMLTAWLTPRQTFIASAASTAFAFTLIGAIRGRVVERSMLRTAVETLLMGGVAATLAYTVGQALEGWVR